MSHKLSKWRQKTWPSWSYPAASLGTEAASGSADGTFLGAAGAHIGGQCHRQQSRA